MAALRRLEPLDPRGVWRGQVASEEFLTRQGCRIADDRDGGVTGGDQFDASIDRSLLPALACAPRSTPR